MATLPQLDIPSSMNRPGPWVILNIRTSSDGDASARPPAPYRVISNDPYRVKIGGLWAEQQGLATPGKMTHAWIISSEPSSY
jgi:hypothetical protein